MEFIMSECLNKIGCGITCNCNLMRCNSVREPTIFEFIKFKLLGPDRGFALGDENRCTHYQGHEVFGHNNPSQKTHKDKCGNEWL